MAGERKLLQLVYISDASAGLTEADIEDIRLRSEANNLQQRLSGLLMFQRPRFFGVLEGTRRRLFARMEIIATDPRHATLRVLRERPIKARRFGNWSFAWMPDSAPDMGMFERPDHFIRTLAQRLG